MSFVEYGKDISFVENNWLFQYSSSYFYFLIKRARNEDQLVGYQPALCLKIV